MNHYEYSDLAVGKEERFEATVTNDAMQKFLEITGDSNPLHLNSSFAVSHGFLDRVVYGMLTASFLSTLGGYSYQERNV